MAIDNARLYAEAQEANRLKDESLAVIAHELRTPMNAISGWVHFLREGRLEAAQTGRALEVIARNVDTQSRVIADLLDMSRILAGKLALEFTKVDPANVAAQVFETFRPAADERGLSLSGYLPREPVIVWGDAARLQQVIWNLLSNAINFRPRGGSVGLELHRGPSHAVTVK